MSKYNIELLKVAIENFIAEKRFLGYRYKNEERRMSSFLKFVVENEILDPCQKKLSYHGPMPQMGQHPEI